jgi:hypothetical protein
MWPWYFVSYLLDSNFLLIKSIARFYCMILHDFFRIWFRFISWMEARPKLYRQTKRKLRTYYRYWRLT